MWSIFVHPFRCGGGRAQAAQPPLQVPEGRTQSLHTPWRQFQPKFWEHATCVPSGAHYLFLCEGCSPRTVSTEGHPTPIREHLFEVCVWGSPRCTCTLAHEVPCAWAQHEFPRTNPREFACTNPTWLRATKHIRHTTDKVNLATCMVGMQVQTTCQKPPMWHKPDNEGAHHAWDTCSAACESFQTVQRPQAHPCRFAFIWRPPSTTSIQRFSNNCVPHATQPRSIIRSSASRGTKPRTRSALAAQILQHQSASRNAVVSPNTGKNSIQKIGSGPGRRRRRVARGSRRRVPLHQLLLGHFTLGQILTSSQLHASLQSPRTAIAQRRGVVHQRLTPCYKKRARSIFCLKTFVSGKRWSREEKQKVEKQSLSSCYPSCLLFAAAANLWSSAACLSSISFWPCATITNNKPLEMNIILALWSTQFHFFVAVLS